MTSPYKIMLYEENKEMYKLIARLGNKLAQEKQLKTLCLQLNICKDEDEFKNIIDELIAAQMFRVVENIYNSKTKLLVVENPALGLVYKDLKKDGININKAKINVNKNRIDKSLYKFDYAIKFAKSNNITDIDIFYEELEKRSSVLYAERRGLDYFTSLTSKNQLFISEQDYNKIKNELLEVTKKQAESVPDRTGKTKEYMELKRGDFYIKAGDELNADLKRIYTPENPTTKRNFDEGTEKEKIKYKNNFNSFLERECILELLEVADISISDAYIKKLVHFKLYILDINEKLNAIKIAEKITKVYDMLNTLFLNPFYEQGEKYKVETDKVVKLDVEVLALNKNRTEEIRTECNYKETSSSNPIILNYLLKELKKNDLNIAKITQNKLIHMDFNNTKIEYKYLNGVCNKNIININQNATKKRIIKENIRGAKEKIETETGVKLDDEAINKIAEILFKKIQES